MDIHEPESGASDPSSEQHDGLSRREALKKGAIAGGAVIWAAPVIQSVGMSPAGAQQPSPAPACVCTGTASFDVRATLTGVITGFVGPIQNFPDEDGCLAVLELRGPGQLPITPPFLTARADCVGGTTTGGTCSASIELADLAVDLRNLLPALDVRLNATAVTAEASCTCGGGCTAEACLVQSGTTPVLIVGGQTLVAGPVNICNQPSSVNINVAGITGVVELLQTSQNPCQATVAHINVSIPNLQTVDLVIARATAVCT
ncbi:MAG: hypothetical protein M3378_11195 [Actinomycetota bacterium]|nr:hypothetical protein [Actinomycetota bacterium]